MTSSVPRDRPLRSDDGVPVVEEVLVVRRDRARAAIGDDVRLGRPVPRNELSADRADGLEPCLGPGLAPTGEAPAAQVDPVPDGRARDRDGQLANVQTWGTPPVASTSRISRRPVADRRAARRSAAAAVCRPGGLARAPASRAGSGGAVRRRGVDRREPACRRRAGDGELQRVRDRRAAGDAVVRVRPAGAAVCVEPQDRVDGVVANEREVDWHRGAGAAARSTRTRRGRSSEG